MTEAPKERKNSNVRNINDLEKEGIELQIAPDTQKTGWKLNTPTSTVEDPSVLKTYLTTPPVKKIDLHFPLGIDLTVRNMKGITIKDALDTMYKTYKKRADDELPDPYLVGFEWDKEESWTRLVVHLSKNPTVPQQTSKKGKKK